MRRYTPLLNGPALTPSLAPGPATNCQALELLTNHQQQTHTLPQDTAATTAAAAAAAGGERPERPPALMSDEAAIAELFKLDPALLLPPASLPAAMPTKCLNCGTPRTETPTMRTGPLGPSSLW